MTIAAIILGVLFLRAFWLCMELSEEKKQAERDLTDERFDNAQLRERLARHQTKLAEVSSFNARLLERLDAVKQSARTRKPNLP